ncbi:MAG: hypothetical protein AMS25_18670 [Gemmatimonas sp. SM23_52]|nr:MAG: hypothetical protein AMS25_18670 [Gemmatimonas sp. SM23_52]
MRADPAARDLHTRTLVSPDRREAARPPRPPRPMRTSLARASRPSGRAHQLRPPARLREGCAPTDRGIRRPGCRPAPRRRAAHP